MIDKAYKDLEPEEIWKHFTALNRIPRPSRHESSVTEYIINVAKVANADWKKDDYGNLVVYVPSTISGQDKSPVLAIQSHLDMVCEKSDDIEHDFFKDVIRPVHKDGKIYADGTTLGADNGIGVAIALALITQPGLNHGPLELMFTVEEEIGLKGAINLDADLLSSGIMINLDSEDENEIIIGCAGAETTHTYLPVSGQKSPEKFAALKLNVSGLKGGHSGVQIHEKLANANIILNTILKKIHESNIQYQISFIEGGGTASAIPRKAFAIIVTDTSNITIIKELFYGEKKLIEQNWQQHEPDIELAIEETALPENVISLQNTGQIINLLNELPHGVIKISEIYPGKVESSSNLASIRLDGDKIHIINFSRSFINEDLRKIHLDIKKTADRFGASVHLDEGFSGWEPRADSVLLEHAINCYSRVYGKPPEIQVIHAGLECGVIISKVKDMDAISFGPRIIGAHTPEEHVYTYTVTTTWNLLVSLLESYLS